MVGLVKSCDIKLGYRSNHSCVQLIIKESRVDRGLGLWKFNLSDSQYIEHINQTIDETLQTMVNYTDFEKWEVLKHEVIQNTIKWFIKASTE